MHKSMAKRITIFTALAIMFSMSGVSYSNNGIFADNSDNYSNYSKTSFIVKTKQEIGVSEATGRISTQTGIRSIDEKNNKYQIKSIRRIFELNNGDAELYKELEMSRIYLFTLDEKSVFDVKEIVKSYSEDENTAYSELNFIGQAAGKKGGNISLLNSFASTPNDEMMYRQWYISNDGSITPSGRRSASRVGADINMLKAWDVETGSPDIIVAILDSGIKDDHPDIRDRIWYNENEIPNNGIDDDRNGYVDDYKGWDFAYEDNRPTDGFGHGTNIASVIGAATNNGIGFAGLDQACKLMNLKNLRDDNFGEYSWWSESVKYAADNGAHVINMSEGGDDYSETLETAIKYALKKGKFIVAAMMNKGDGRDYYPASFKGVCAVGATDTDDNRCTQFSWGGGSCYGKHIAVVAPGNKIYGLDYEDIRDYTVYWSGTSQSTAIVSALASLLLSQNPNRTNKDIDKILKVTARDQVGDRDEDSPGWDKYYGYGRVDAFLALTYDSTPEIMERIKEVERSTRVEENKKRNNENEAKEEKSRKEKEADARVKSKPSNPE
jgi:thermitase